MDDSKIKTSFIQIDTPSRDRFVNLLANHPHLCETEMGYGGMIDRWVEKEWDDLKATPQEKAEWPLANLIAESGAPKELCFELARELIAKIMKAPKEVFEKTSHEG